jgi:hypothetical protein
MLGDRRFRVRSAGVFAVLCFAALSVLVTDCAPSARDVSCRNDGECRDRGESFNYCLQHRCVECVGSSRCKAGFVCRDGTCELR